MLVCQVNQEQGLLNAQYVVKILGQLKTRTEDLMEKSDYRNTALKTAGLGVQLYMLIVGIVAKKLRQLRVRTNNTVIWNVVIRAISIEQARKLEHGKAKKHLTRLYISGLRHIIRSLMFVNIAKRKAIQSGLTYRKTTIEKEMTGLTCASPVTSSLTVKNTRILKDINRVIRKRYAKFISPDDWEAKWEELTPAISGEKQAV